MKEFIESKYRMNLQLFGEEGDGNEPDNGNNSEPGTDEPVTFASQSDFDSAVDKRMNKALETAQSNWEKTAQERINKAKQEGLTEGQKLAQMTEEERKKAKEDDFEKRQADITRRELRLSALEELENRKLPTGLVDAIKLDDSDSCKTSIDAVEEAFRAEVEKAVNGRLASSANNTKPGAGSGAKTEKGSYGKELGEKFGTKKTESNYF